MASTDVKWEDLRRQARQLENEIDSKLVTFSRVAANLISSSSTNSDKQPLISPDQVESELDQLISNLTTVNSQMSELSTSAVADTTLLHTTQRHADILQNYTHEFRRTRSHVQTKRQRQQLLGNHRVADSSDLNNGGINRRMENLLREHEHIRNSDRLIDQQISIAMETREHLGTQRATFKAMQTRINDIAHRFPMINSLLQRIQLRKRRDALVLGVVIGLCLIFFIWYLSG